MPFILFAFSLPRVSSLTSFSRKRARKKHTHTCLHLYYIPTFGELFALFFPHLCFSAFSKQRLLLIHLFAIVCESDQNKSPLKCAKKLELA